MTPQPQAAVGAPLTRVDARLKVTGQARYAADFDADGLVHAVVVDSGIGLGRITSVDTTAALALPGVLTVLTHLNAPRLPYGPNPGMATPPGERLHVLEDDRVRFHGQPIAVVVATTLETARHAARLVRVEYDAEPPSTDLSTAADDTPVTYERGDAERALRSADVRLELTYRTARQHHNAMEPHATVARWDDGRLTVWQKTQWIHGAQAELAAVFGLPEDAVRVVSPFVGGAFGNASRIWPQGVMAALAAREVDRPVKLVLSRRQLYFGTGYRPGYEYQVRLGSDGQGRLTAMTHVMRAETSRYETFQDDILSIGQMLYDVPAVTQDWRTVPLDVSTPTFMRGPGGATAAYAVESAMDELAWELGLDPVELRLRNEPDRDPTSGLPFSTRRLRECYARGARAFGWHLRDPKPRSTRDGDWLIGTGMATGAHPSWSVTSLAHVRLDADGTAVVQSATSDMGPGTYTVMTQVAADALGLPVRAVRFELGDSTMPPPVGHGGSMTTPSVGSAVQDGCAKLRGEAVALAVKDEESPLFGVAADDVVVADGRLYVRDEPARGETYRSLLARSGRDRLEADGEYVPAGLPFSTHSYSVTFAEVAVDARLGLVRVRRMLGVYDVGRVINPKLADSQAIGGMIGGIGQALLEHTVTDHRDGRIVNANLADYLVPVNADIPDLKAIYLEGEDDKVARIGAKGLGEVVHVGVAPALANAVFHATGRRIRELPITADALL
ncbi:xanthine dehydrogenase family protein molybdopterin-binding subunit [Streptomyces sp. T028]|uniref:xanthine dehydrogenase family protein molybdopterin-binding subunit n=1 Tax=Streptomyces sp. T028 TaxID=3394379 RepID=UPI003A8A6815